MNQTLKWKNVDDHSLVWIYRKDQVECWDDYYSQKGCKIFKGVVACQNKMIKLIIRGIIYAQSWPSLPH